MDAGGPSPSVVPYAGTLLACSPTDRWNGDVTLPEPHRVILERGNRSSGETWPGGGSEATLRRLRQRTKMRLMCWGHSLALEQPTTVWRVIASRRDAELTLQ